MALVVTGGAAAVLLTRDGATKSAPTLTTTAETGTRPAPRSQPAGTDTAPRRETVGSPATTTQRPPTTTRAPSTTVVAGTRQAVTKPRPATTIPPADATTIPPAVATTIPPAAATDRVLSWTPVPGARVYLFELLRQGSLGRAEVLQAWPSGPELRLPGGLEPGLYLWSAAPQARRGATVRSTTLTRAGRFRITESGRLVRLS